MYFLVLEENVYHPIVTFLLGNDQHLFEIYAVGGPQTLLFVCFLPNRFLCVTSSGCPETLFVDLPASAFLTVGIKAVSHHQLDIYITNAGFGKTRGKMCRL